MPLVPAVLIEEILKMNDDTRGDFIGWPMVLDALGAIDTPASQELAAQNWANAAGVYLATISVPPGAVAGVPAAVVAFKSAMAPLLAAPPQSSATGICSSDPP